MRRGLLLVSEMNMNIREKYKSDNCLILVAAQVAAHFDCPNSTPVPKHKLVSVATWLKERDLEVIALQHWFTAILPTARGLRRAGVPLVTLHDEAIALIRKVQSRPQPYAVIALGSAKRLYGLSEGWTHAVSFLGTGVRRMTLYDPLLETDPDLDLALLTTNVEEYVGKWDVLTLLIKHK